MSSVVARRRELAPGRVAGARSRCACARSRSGQRAHAAAVSRSRSEGDEPRFLDPKWSDGRAKNISLDGTAIKGAHGDADDLRRSPEWSDALPRTRRPDRRAVSALRAASSTRARTSYRPQPATGRGHVGARTTRGCTSTHSHRGPIAASASCACSATSIPWRRSRVAGRRAFEPMARRCHAGHSRRCARSGIGAAGGAARHQGADAATTII